MRLNGALREDTHKKLFFFSGRTTKGVGRLNPTTTKQKKTFFSINPAFLAQKFEKKKNGKNPLQAIIRLKNKTTKKTVASTTKPLV